MLWTIQPDLIIETGIARGGSLIFYASVLECAGLQVSTLIFVSKTEKQFGYPMSKRIEIGIENKIAEQVKRRARIANKVLVCLDSNHTHDHVLEELRLYAPLVSLNSYIIVFDTVVEEMILDRPWAKGNNPKTAVFEYLKDH